jgi:hypothetical protein
VIWSDDLFKGRLHTGRFWENQLATKLEERGHPVTTTPLVFRDDISQAPEFTRNQKDLRVYDHVIEVKSRPIHFGWEPESIPERFMPFIVDDADKWDAKLHKPSAYVFISQKTGRFVCLQGSTRGQWRKMPFTDRVMRTTKDYYVCDRGLLKHGRALLRSLNKIAVA